MPLWSRRTYSPALASAAGRLQKAARLKSKNPFPSQHQRIRAQPVTCGITKAPVKTASKKKKKKVCITAQLLLPKPKSFLPLQQVLILRNSIGFVITFIYFQMKKAQRS